MKIKRDRYLFTLLLLLISVTPLLVGPKERFLYSPYITTLSILNSGVKYDFFTFYKMSFILLITLSMAALFIYQLLKHKRLIIKSKLTKWLVAFAIIITVSTLLSNHTHTALWGNFNRSEGLLTYYCYLIITWLTTQIELPKDYLRKIAIALMPTVLINATLATLYYLNINVLSWVGSAVFKSDEISYILGTLNQENYISGYFAMITGFYLGVLLFAASKKNQMQYIAMLILSMYTMLLAHSSTGFITVCALLIFCLSLMAIGRHKKQIVLVISTAILFGFLAFAVAFWNERIWEESFGFINLHNEQTTYSQQIIEPIEATTYEEFVLPILPNKTTTPLSSRFYIWEKTIEVAMERPIIGYGFDTLLFEFPHFNIDARAGISTERIIVDKPHSIYIGYFFSTGILGLVVYMAIVLIILLNTMKLLRNPQVLPLLLVIIAYCIQGLTVDTNIGVTLLFWIFGGVILNFTAITSNVRHTNDFKDENP